MRKNIGRRLAVMDQIGGGSRDQSVPAARWGNGSTRATWENSHLKGCSGQVGIRCIHPCIHRGSGQGRGLRATGIEKLVRVL